jgi:tRNA wybutosine-synthesizing protein 2
MAVHGNPKRVYACELNPVSYRYLVQNIRLNKVKGKVEPLEGDCRLVAPEGLADRVVLGHFDSLQFIPKAVRVLGPAGGILHVHQLCQKRLPGPMLFHRVRKAVEAAGKKAGLLRVVRVKSFKPHVWHRVVDVRVGAD